MKDPGFTLEVKLGSNLDGDPVRNFYGHYIWEASV
jgi:hypothetical protein